MEESIYLKAPQVCSHYFDVFLLDSEPHAECLACMLAFLSSIQLKRPVRTFEHWLTCASDGKEQRTTLKTKRGAEPAIL